MGRRTPHPLEFGRGRLHRDDGAATARVAGTDHSARVWAAPHRLAAAEKTLGPLKRAIAIPSRSVGLAPARRRARPPASAAAGCLRSPAVREGSVEIHPYDSVAAASRQHGPAAHDAAGTSSRRRVVSVQVPLGHAHFAVAGPQLVTWVFQMRILREASLGGVFRR